MKKSIYCFTAAVLAFGALFGFVGCDGSGSNLTNEPNVGISQGVSDTVGEYDKVAYYELENPGDVKFKFETSGKIQKVSFKYTNVDYSVKNDEIILKQSLFENETAGEKRIRVFVDNRYVEVKLRVVTKVIYTTQDFLSIGEHMNGVYVLGNDIDFGGEGFWPIGKASVPDKNGNFNDTAFEGIFDGMGHAVKNVTVYAHDYNGENPGHQEGDYTVPTTGPNTGTNFNDYGRNYNAGIFAATSANAQILNTNFSNVTVYCQGLGGAVVGANGGLIKNCRVSCTLYSYGGYSEKAGGIAGLNSGGDTNGKIENCIVTATYGAGTIRGIADWNTGTISNCYAAQTDDFVYYYDYNPETGERDLYENFDINTYFNQTNFSDLLGNYSIVAFPGALQWVNGVLNYYPGGTITNSDVVTKSFLLDPANFPEENGWDRSVWYFHEGVFPTLIIQNR